MGFGKPWFDFVPMFTKPGWAIPNHVDEGRLDSFSVSRATCLQVLRVRKTDWSLAPSLTTTKAGPTMGSAAAIPG